MAQIQYTPYVNQVNPIQNPQPNFEIDLPKVTTRKKQEEISLAPLPEIKVMPETITKGIISNPSNYNIGNMQDALEGLANAGISFRITSGIRPGAMTKSGHRSHHADGNAVDIVVENNDWESARKKVKASKELQELFRSKGWGILDETTSDVMSKTGATGAHWHIGPDRWARQMFETMVAKKGAKLQNGQKINYTPFVQTPIYAWFNDKHKDRSNTNVQEHAVTLVERVPKSYQKQFDLSDEPRVENGFDNWYKYVSQTLGLDPDPDSKEHYYDYRSFYDDLIKDGKQYEVIGPEFHFPDTYKLPGHPTFSMESKYYKEGMGAGWWDGDTYIKPKDEYDERIHNRYFRALNALLNNGVDEETAMRVSPFIASASLMETGWNSKEDTNNYGGYLIKTNKGERKLKKFNSEDEFWDYHIKNLKEKWPKILQATNMDEYYDAINHSDLGLTTKEKHAEYNRQHRNNPVYLYAPEWENTNYRQKLNNMYNRFVHKYLK